MSHEQPERWVTIHDQQLSSEALEARVEARLARRRKELGGITRRFPSFDARPVDGDDDATGEAFQEVLRRLETLPPPATHPALATSPMTRLPLLGSLWRLIRRQAHELVLFYVNRQLAHQTQTNHLVLSTLKAISEQLAQQEDRQAALESRLATLEDRLITMQSRANADQDLDRNGA